jgi:chromosome segregation ATPase
MNTATQWEALRRQLEDMKSAVAAEIQSYPRPIAGCDAQFNHLLERRRQLWDELSRLDAVRRDRSKGVEDFLQSSTCLDSEARRAILDVRRTRQRVRLIASGL